MLKLPLRLEVVLAALAGIVFATSTHAADVIAVEEHWEMTVGGPDQARCAPQASMVMSPVSTLDGRFFVFTLNHWSYPEFATGGMQVQLWQGEECISCKHGLPKNLLSNDGEVLSWKQRLAVENGVLTFEVIDGSSETWGGFGGAGVLRFNLETSLTRLNEYRPAISIGDSGIGFAGNRVSSLTLKRLRWTTDDDQVHELVAPIDIDTDIDP